MYNASFSVCVCACICVLYACAHECVCVCISLRVCVCVCACMLIKVCEWMCVYVNVTTARPWDPKQYILPAWWEWPASGLVLVSQNQLCWGSPVDEHGSRTAHATAQTVSQGQECLFHQHGSCGCFLDCWSVERRQTPKNSVRLRISVCNLPCSLDQFLLLNLKIYFLASCQPPHPLITINTVTDLSCSFSN